MNSGPHGASRRGAASRKPYKKPKLAVHGDVRELTRTKKGTFSDGGSKPKTRASGFNA